MEYLDHVAIRHDARLHHATCLRCGLRSAAPSEALPTRILQLHPCKSRTLDPAFEPSPSLRFYLALGRLQNAADALSELASSLDARPKDQEQALRNYCAQASMNLGRCLRHLRKVGRQQHL